MSNLINLFYTSKEFFQSRFKVTNQFIECLDMQKIDMGIALCHFALTAKELGLELSFVLDDPKFNLEADTEYVASYIKIREQKL